MKGGSWHTRYICSKAILVTVITCCLNRSCDCGYAFYPCCTKDQCVCSHRHLIILNKCCISMTCVHMSVFNVCVAWSVYELPKQFTFGSWSLCHGFLPNFFSSFHAIAHIRAITVYKSMCFSVRRNSLFSPDCLMW